MAKYLSRLGWRVTVLTSQQADYRDLMSPEGVRANVGIPESQVIRRALPAGRAAPRSRLLRKLGGLADILCLPGSPSARWPRLVLSELDGRGVEPDVIWATAPHWGTFLAASALARRRGVPWVADHRDLPDQFLAHTRVRRRIALWREKQVCRSPAHMTTVSDPMAEMLRQRYRVPVTVIPNGFDPDTFCEKPALPDADVFRIVYTGSVWGPRSLAPLVEAVSSLVAAGEVPEDRIEVLLYGLHPDYVRVQALDSFTRPPVALPKLPLSEVVGVQRRATVLFVLGMPGARGVLTTKLFEYMAAGRPVLAYPGDPECMDRVLKATGVGVSCNSVDELKAVLQRWYEEWSATGDIRMSRDRDEVMSYSREEQAKVLASVLDRVVAEHQG